MNNPVIFLVDEVNDDKTLGWTNNITKVLHNLERLPKDWRKSFSKDLENSDTGMTAFFIAGRFIVLLVLMNDKTKGAMTFFDTKQDFDLAYKIARRFDKQNWIEPFLKQHSDLQSYYEIDHDLAVLSTDNSVFN